MRTKTLLLTAALVAAGAAATQAADVYSVNSVGYANVTAYAHPGGGYGFNMITCPFVVADDDIATLLPAPPDQTVVFTYNNTSQSFFGPFTYYGAPDNIWDPPTGGLESKIRHGGGAFIRTQTTFAITFVGEVNQGNPVGATITNPLKSGFTMVGSKVPQDGDLIALGLGAPLDQTYMFQYQRSATVEQYLGPFTYYGAPDNIWDPAPLPTHKIGEAMWIHSPADQSWNRNFTVN